MELTEDGATENYGKQCMQFEKYNVTIRKQVDMFFMWIKRPKKKKRTFENSTTNTKLYQSIKMCRKKYVFELML